MTSIKALPTTTASAKEAIQAACLGVETPKPTPTGSEVACLTAATCAGRWFSRCCRAPVTPVTET